MIASLRGTPHILDEHTIVVDVQGVGYLVRATTAVIQRASLGEGELQVYVYTNVRDDAIQLFGFGSLDEQHTFEKMLSLQGVGPKVALSIVSSYAPADIARAVESDDAALFQSISGIGPKVARRIVTELRGKLGVAVSTTTLGATVDSVGLGGHLDVRAALVELGMTLADAEVALKATDPEAAPEERIKQALTGRRA